MAADLGAVVDTVVSIELRALSVGELQEQYATLAPQVQRLTGFGGAVLAELAARGGGTVPTADGKPRPLPGWAAEASGDSASAAGRLQQTASALQTGLPKVAQAVLDGTVPFVRAQVLTRLVGKISPEALAEAEDGLVVTARLMDPTSLADYVRHLLAQWVEPVIDDAEVAASAARYLKTRTQPNGSVWGSFLLPAGNAESVLTGIEALARKQSDQDTRSAAQRRADALTEVFEQLLKFGDLPDTGGFRPQLSYVLPADWAARQAGEHTCADCRRCPTHQPASFAELVAAGIPSPAGTAAASSPGAAASTDAHSLAGAGTSTVPATHGCAVAAWTGPQTRSRIETMLCDARITRVLLDSVGQVTGLQPLRDSVTAAQRRALVARDRGCIARGCSRPPAFCDAHHLTARADGGPTVLDNLVLLCRRHHVLWHLGKISLHDLQVPWIGATAGPAPPRAQPPPPPRTTTDDVRGLFVR